jgi:hypothetical protein
MVGQTKKNIINDNIEEAKKVKKAKDYVKMVRGDAIEYFGSLENYVKFNHGQVLEVNL